MADCTLLAAGSPRAGFLNGSAICEVLAVPELYRIGVTDRRSISPERLPGLWRYLGQASPTSFVVF